KNIDFLRYYLKLIKCTIKKEEAVPFIYDTASFYFLLVVSLNHGLRPASRIGRLASVGT
ncbi:hypothetical protein FHW36_1141, partial [Chitinophaga polysaccharea]